MGTNLLFFLKAQQEVSLYLFDIYVVEESTNDFFVKYDHLFNF